MHRQRRPLRSRRTHDLLEMADDHYAAWKEGSDDAREAFRLWVVITLELMDRLEAGDPVLCTCEEHFRRFPDE